MELVVNGQSYRAQFTDGTLLDLLAELERDPRTVAIERNGEIVPRSRFGEQLLGAGDRLEIVQFVQGG